MFHQKYVYWDTSGFQEVYLGKGSVPSIYADSLDTDYPRNEGRLALRFFQRNILWVFLWDPTMRRQYSKNPRIRSSASKNPHPKIWGFSGMKISS